VKKDGEAPVTEKPAKKKEEVENTGSLFFLVCHFGPFLLACAFCDYTASHVWALFVDYCAILSVIVREQHGVVHVKNASSVLLLLLKISNVFVNQYNPGLTMSISVNTSLTVTHGCGLWGDVCGGQLGRAIYNHGQTPGAA
jgi:hypothetical protein